MASHTSAVLKAKIQAAFDGNVALKDAARDIASDVQSGVIKLYLFMEELGPFITDSDISLRGKGISLLSSVLLYLPKDFLNEAELHFITSFYCDRLKDHHSIIPFALEGILAIAQMQHLPHDSPPRIFTVLFQHVSCQSQVLVDRHKIYLIFATFLENRLDDLKSMGPDFVYGVITTMDGERDPRNLILLFTMLPNFIKEFPLGHLTEEMFEVISCYFPVDFNPSGAEGLGITREDLAEKLAPCLCATPEFAEFCMPLLIDKLFSSLKVAKQDCLDLLCIGAPVFGPNGLATHVSELWSVLRKELLPGGDVELRNASLKALASVLAVISDDTSLRESFIDKIITDTKSSLCDVQLSLFSAAKKLLEAVAMVNKDCCTQVLRAVIPLCLGQYSTKTLLTDKVILVETMNNFLKISADHGFSIKSVPELSWTDMPQLYLSELGLQHTELKCKILLGLTIQKAYLNETHRGILYDTICNEIDKGSQQIESLCHTCISSFATMYPKEILNLMKERMQLNNGEVKIEVQIRRLKALSAVAQTPELGIEVLPKIVSQANADNFEISFTTLTCIHRLVATKNSDFNIQHYLYTECNIIEKLTSFNIDTADPRTMLIASICRLVVKSLTTEEQQKIVDRYSKILYGSNSEISVILTMNVLIPLRQNVVMTISPNMLEKLYNLAAKSASLNVKQTSCKFSSVVLNKTNDEQCFQEILSYFKDRIVKDLQSDDVDSETKQAIVSLQVWLSKAVITRGSCDVESCLNDLTCMFKHDQIGQHIAQECKILTSTNEDALSIENFCNVRFLYKQRVFEHLIQKNSDFEGASRQNYLTALTQLLDEVPVELLFMNLQKLVPLLIESLSLDNERLIFSTLTALKILLDTKNEIFSDKIQCFIPRFLKLSSYKTMRVRIAALECLTTYCCYPTIIIKKYKQDVIEKLIPVLDDRKRLVRRAAVKTRAKWFLVGAPGGTKER